jgi:adenylyltransferase/sulfurtransferase
MVLSIRESSANTEDRFSRFELISWWEQARLRQAKVLLIGAGALGKELIKNCALLGVGRILVADMDRIEHSNLTRSVLFREADEGRFKAEVACQAAQQIYPGIKTEPFVGNIVHDLGWGVYLWADVILGGLDNREARVAINSAAMFARKPWIDGAIEVLDGVARVFVPGDGPCYECTMSALDWKLLESRRSCALLTRAQLQEGKVPTTPTTGSIIAGVQTQELLKLLHGMPALAGKGFVYSGLTGESYTVTYTRKPDCFAHDSFSRLEHLPEGVTGLTVHELLLRARKDLGAEAVLELHRDVVVSLQCARCQTQEPVFKALGKVTEKEGRCPACGQMRAPETATTLDADGPWRNLTFAQLGLPPWDIVSARAGEKAASYVFQGDAAGVLKTLRD